jgi:hypothetical protein
MLRPWQPYPSHPQVRGLTRLIAELQERALEALVAKDTPTAKRLCDDMGTARERLAELTTALLRDESLNPRWNWHTKADAAAGAVPCLECGNNMPAGVSCCSYCGWTYLANKASVEADDGGT